MDIDTLRSDERALASPLDPALDIRIVDFARQGDVLVIPERLLPLNEEPVRPIPAQGVAVVRGEYGGHTHQLVADGEVRFAESAPSVEVDDGDALVVGVIRVGEGSVGYLIHPEHGAIGLAPGGYTVRRQREWSEVVRFVND